ncbi:MAG: hypothetical protein ACK5AZ_16955 [Bryobacteraceae bacterium]
MIKEATLDHPRHEEAKDSYHLDERQWTRVRNSIVFVLLAAWVASGAGYVLDRTQFNFSYLVGFVFFVSIALGGLFFTMVQYLTGSAWSVTMRRFMEAIGASLPAGILLFVPIALGLSDLYKWTNHDLVANDHILHGKASYLNENFFLIRAGVCILIWSLWGWRLFSNSVRQDRTKSIEHMHTASRWSAPGLLVVMVTGSVAAFDWVMSLDPHWYSTIFGIYVLSGGALAFMATMTLICLAFRSSGILSRTITIEHMHDLGKWMFALTIFWAYIAFSQYLLIWYANMPEETLFYKHRFEGSWGLWSLLLLAGHFIAPFLILMRRAAKRSTKVLGVMAVWILFIHFVDVYWLIMPTYSEHGFHLHWLDLATLAAVGSVFALVFWARFRRNSLVAYGDPRFEQGLHFHNV